MLNKFEKRDLELIRIIADKGRIQDARRAAAEWIKKAGDNQGVRERRERAASELFWTFRAEGRARAQNGL